MELGRLDGLSSTKSSVDGKLPAPFFNLDQLNKIFAANGLSQADMIALSGTYGTDKISFPSCKPRQRALVSDDAGRCQSSVFSWL